MTTSLRLVTAIAVVAAATGTMAGCSSTVPTTATTTAAASSPTSPASPNDGSIMNQAEVELLYSQITADWASIKDAGGAACASQLTGGVPQAGLIAQLVGKVADYDTKWATADKIHLAGPSGMPHSITIPSGAATTAFCTQIQ